MALEFVTRKSPTVRVPMALPFNFLSTTFPDPYTMTILTPRPESTSTSSNSPKSIASFSITWLPTDSTNVLPLWPSMNGAAERKKLTNIPGSASARSLHEAFNRGS